MDRRDSGHRRTPITIETVTARTPAGDGYTDVWTAQAATFADVRPVLAGDLTIAGTVRAGVTHQVRLDYAAYPGLKADARLVVAGRPLYCRGVRDEEERHVTWICDCEELPS